MLEYQVLVVSGLQGESRAPAAGLEWQRGTCCKEGRGQPHADGGPLSRSVQRLRLHALRRHAALHAAAAVPHGCPLQRFWVCNAYALVLLGVVQAVAGVTATLFLPSHDADRQAVGGGVSLLGALF